MQLNIRNEFSTLEQVIVGIADNSGGRPHLEETYDPKTREYVRKGVYPYDEDMHEEMEYFVKVLERHNVEVLRPRNINNLNQIFTRDLCFVLDDKLIIPEIIREREDEQEGINHIIQKLSKDQIHDSPEGIRIEGGDVVLDDRFVFVGYSNEEDFYTYKTSRTNEAGLNYIREKFPDREVLGFQLNKSDYEPLENALHLDCCFQPLGLGHVLVFEDGFRNEKDLETLRDLYGADKMIKVDRHEMYLMACNILSISRELIVTERGFVRVNEKLRSLGYQLEEIPYYQISKLEGLLRCSTLPLRRKND